MGGTNEAEAIRVKGTGTQRKVKASVSACWSQSNCNYPINVHFIKVHKELQYLSRWSRSSTDGTWPPTC